MNINFGNGVFNSVTELRVYLESHQKALAADLSQNPSHAVWYQGVKALNKTALLEPVKKIVLAAEILRTAKEERLTELIGTTPAYQEVQELARLMQDPSPEMDQELSFLRACALKLTEKSIEKARTVVDAISDPAERAMALAAWINYHRLPLADTQLTPEELMVIAPYLHTVIINFNTLKFDDPLSFIALCSNAYHLCIALDQIKVLEKLPPRLQKLECSRCDSLTSVNFSQVPHLRELNFYTCPALTTLAIPANLQNLYLSFCEGLKTLTLSPARDLIDFQCHGCVSLTTLSLTDAPELQKFSCIRSPALVTLALPALPQLKKFSCRESGITRLTLPETPQLEEYNCNNCPSLTGITLPYTPRLKIVECRENNALRTFALPFAPQVEDLDCTRCTNLTTIASESFPKCWRIDCEHCPNLSGFPQLPPTVNIWSGYGGSAFLSFYVNPLTLEENPRQVFLELGSHLLANQPMPNIVWLDAETNQPAQGIDAGGLRRQLVTTLCENLGNLGEDVLAWRILARLIALCSTSGMLMGEYLPISFFYALRAHLFQEGEIEENPQAAIVAEELKRIPNYSLDLLRDNPARFIESVRGKPVTKEALLAAMQFEGMRDYFEKYMVEYPHKLADLVELFTSCRTLGEQPIIIRVYPTWDSRLLPLIHTCSQEVEMPFYPAYEHFKEKLNTAFATLKTFENA